MSVPSRHLFWVLLTGSELCPRAGILESIWNNQRPRQPVLTFCRGSTDLVQICSNSQAVLRETSPDYGSLCRWAYFSLDLPESVPGPLRSAPSVRKQAALDGIFSRFFIFSSSSIQTVYMGSAPASTLQVLLQVGMTGNLRLLVVQSSACSPTKAPLRSSLQQNVQPSFTQQCSRPY